jgi:putative resolvase
MDQHIERILNQVPGWNAADAGVAPLVGGITNQNFRVDIGGETFVLRIGGKGTHLLGIDRGRESICTSIAAQVGVGAEVIHFLPAEDVLVTRFIAGKAITSEIAAQHETLRRIVDSMKRYHAGPAFPGTFSPFETVRSYHTLALENNVTFPKSLPQVFALMEQIEQALATSGTTYTRPCHNDLLASNFIDDNHSIRILDWEYRAKFSFFTTDSYKMLPSLANYVLIEYIVSMKLSNYAKKLGIHYNTAYRMFRRGQIAGYQLPTGTVIIEEPVDKAGVHARPGHLVAVYARVSSSENKKNLDTQAERLITWCNAQGWSVSKVVKECGSGINDQRPKFLALLANREIGRIVVEHKDRASRFGVAYIQTLLSLQDRELVVVNTADTTQDDLMGDFVAIITSFCARLYGRRRAKRKTERVLAALQQNGPAREQEAEKSD